MRSAIAIQTLFVKVYLWGVCVCMFVRQDTEGVTYKIKIGYWSY